MAANVMKTIYPGNNNIIVFLIAFVFLLFSFLVFISVKVNAKAVQ